MRNNTVIINLMLALTCTQETYFSQEIKQVFDSSYSYENGKFDSHREIQEIYTTPFRPQIPPTQSVMIYEDSPQQLPYETVLKKVVEGKDSRIKIEDTTVWPYLVHGQLTMSFIDTKGKRERYGGSGVLIGPHHMLTAAHNIYSHENGWAQDITVYLALNDQVAPFAKSMVTQACTFKDWIEKKSADHDMALLILNDSIGSKTGWYGLLATEEPLHNYEVSITGYPGDKGFKQMWSMTDKIKKVEQERIFYEIDTYGGQSGRGIWINKWGSPYVVGVHTLGTFDLDKGYNSGSRLSLNKINIILDWIRATHTIKLSVSDSDNSSGSKAYRESPNASFKEKSPSEISQYLQTTPWSQIQIATQDEILTFMQGQIFRELYLKNCQRITPEIWRNIPFNSLIHLDIAGCLGVDQPLITPLSQTCSQLQYLDVSHTSIEGIYEEGLIQYKPFKGTCLKTLKASYCSRLKTINGNFPSLQDFNTEATFIKYINIPVWNLKKVYLNKKDINLNNQMKIGIGLKNQKYFSHFKTKRAC